MKRPDKPAAGLLHRRGSWLLLALVSLSGLAGSSVGGFGLKAWLVGNRSWEGRAHTLLAALILASALPLGLFAWRLSRRGQTWSGALVLLAVPLGAVAQVGLDPDLWQAIGVLFAPFFLAALLLSLGGPERSWSLAALALVSWGAIGAGAVLPGALEDRLRDAARTGEEGRARRLLVWRVDPDGRDDRGVSPLMLAVEANDERMTRLLLERGADPDLADSSGRSAKMRAIEEHRSNLTLLLLGFPLPESGGSGRYPTGPEALP